MRTLITTRVLRGREVFARVLRASPVVLLLSGCAGLHTARLGSDGAVAPIVAGAPAKVITGTQAEPPNESPFPVAHKLFDLSDTRINESSGIGASRRYPGVLWTHNDSGDLPRLFMIATTGGNAGKTIAEVKLQGATATDWEDMAVAGTGKDASVYVGDIGDNAHKRGEVAVYRFPEPKLDVGVVGQSITVECEKMTLSYPDGAHDAETLIVNSTGELLIATKTASGESVMYKTPQPFAPGTKQQLLKVGAYKFEATGIRSRLTTSGDLSPDERHLVIRTYTKAYQWALPADVDWTKVWPGTPQSWTLPETVQGEAICYSADGHKLFTSSEQLPTPVFELSRGAG